MNEDLQDNINYLELIFSMLGERVSTETTKNNEVHKR